MRRWMLCGLFCAMLPATAAEFKPIAVDGWLLGAQAWTFSKLTLLETIDQCAALGIEYLEAYPGQKVSPDGDAKFQPGCPDDVQELVKAKLAETGVKLVQLGVIGLPNNEDGARKVFEFAKGFGIQTLTSEPPEAALPMLDKLCEEYDMRIAIHDHPNPSHYWNPQIVLDAVKDCSPRIGACADTGHWARSGLDPVECLQQLEGRIVSLHFKDINEVGNKGAHDVPWGTGACNAEALLKELQRQGFKGLFSIEYEKKDADLVTNVAKCVEWFHATTDKLAVE